MTGKWLLAVGVVALVGACSDSNEISPPWFYAPTGANVVTEPPAATQANGYSPGYAVARPTTACPAENCPPAPTDGAP